MSRAAAAGGVNARFAGIPRRCVPFLTLALPWGLPACARPEDRQELREAGVVAPASVPAADPLAGFARLVGGEWKMTCEAGTSLYDTWHWGPGRHSLRCMTDGLAADGTPWRALAVVYWHPGDRRLRTLGLSPFQAGVSEGVATFRGSGWESVMDMYQTGGQRKLMSRAVFEGPDRYRDELLESSGGGAGYVRLVAWERLRMAKPATPRPWAVEGVEKPSEALKAFGGLLDRRWGTSGEARGDWARGDALPFQAKVEWVPLANAVYLRVDGVDRGAASAPARVKASDVASGPAPAHLLDAYIFHHTGTKAVRCLALARDGGVFEGDVAVLDGKSLQVDLSGSDGSREVSYQVRVDFEGDAVLRSRVWSVRGGARTLMLDARHPGIEPGSG